MEDIVTRLRKTRANMIGTDDEPHYWDCHDAAAEIQRLRLTDDERQAIWVAAKWCKEPIHPVHSKTSLDAMCAANTLRTLLARLA